MDAVLTPMPRQLLKYAAVGTLVMLVVGMFVAALGIGALKLFGGAAQDTSMVVLTAAYAIADFWGGGLVYLYTRARPFDVARAWALTRAVTLAGLVAIAGMKPEVAAVQLVLAVPAAWFGALLVRKHEALTQTGT